MLLASYGRGNLAMEAKLRIAQWKERKPRLSPDEIRLVCEGGKVVSLWDMIVILADGIIRALSALELEGTTHFLETPQKRTLSKKQKGQLIEILKSLEAYCVVWQLEKSLDRCEDLRIKLERVPQKYETDFDKRALEPKPRAVFNECTEIRFKIEGELEGRYCIIIPKQKSSCLVLEKAFGEGVIGKLSDAAPEIKEAGNCLAVGLHTAAVFHLMRASECGLRVLAEELQAWTEAWPIEYAQWSQVIDAIEKKLRPKIDEADRMSKGADKEKAQSLYHGLLDDVKYLKVDRNKVMHTRCTCSPDDAQSVMGRVRSFMLRVAEMVKEEN
jgi:hypothetical protein